MELQIHTYHSHFTPRWGSRGNSDSYETPTFYQNHLSMSNTADVIGTPSPFAINPLDAFYDIHGGKKEVLFFYFVPDTTQGLMM
jgi:hypothetical protein